jgi:hypothetical protein
MNSNNDKGVEEEKYNPNTENRNEAMHETVAIPWFLPRSFRAVHPVRCHAYATLVPVVVSQPTPQIVGRCLMHIYNPEFYGNIS